MSELLSLTTVEGKLNLNHANFQTIFGMVQTIYAETDEAKQAIRKENLAKQAANPATRYAIRGHMAYAEAMFLEGEQRREKLTLALSLYSQECQWVWLSGILDLEDGRFTISKNNIFTLYIEVLIQMIMARIGLIKPTESMSRLPTDLVDIYSLAQRRGAGERMPSLFLDLFLRLTKINIHCAQQVLDFICQNCPETVQIVQAKLFMRLQNLHINGVKKEEVIFQILTEIIDEYEKIQQLLNESAFAKALKHLRTEILKKIDEFPILILSLPEKEKLKTRLAAQC